MTQKAAEMSDALAQIVSAAGPGVVRVEGRRRLPASGILWGESGLVVTAHHVLERVEGLTVGVVGGGSYPAQLVGRDPGRDLAVLRMEMEGLDSADWTEDEGIKVGHLCLALGRPGEGIQATLGIVSALGEGWRTPMGGGIDRYLQTDVVMYPGFSGGPLVNMEGKFLGMNTSAIRGVSLAVPYRTLERVVPMLVEHGGVRQAYLGVGVQPARLPRKLAEDLDQRTGLLVISVEPDSPADKAGITLGDTLIRLEGSSIRHLDGLLAELHADRIGKVVELEVLRGGQMAAVEVKLVERE